MKCQVSARARRARLLDGDVWLYQVVVEARETDGDPWKQIDESYLFENVSDLLNEMALMKELYVENPPSVLGVLPTW